MEKKTRIKAAEVLQGFYIELSCSQCLVVQSFAGTTKKEVLEKITVAGWVNLDSDFTETCGHWCGCDYK